MKYEEYAGNGKKKKRPSEASEIESDVEMIRGEMAETLRQIEAKFSPRSLIDEAVEVMRRWRQGPSQFSRNFGIAIRDNPIPVLLTGIGVVALLVSQRRQSAGQLGESTSTQEATGAAQEKWSKVSQRGREGAEGLRRRGRQFAESTSQGLARTRGAVQSAGRRAQDVAHEQPLVVIGLGLALGALVAGTVRMSERERGRVAEMRESFEEGARTKMREASGEEQGSAAHGEAERHPEDPEETSPSSSSGAYSPDDE